MLDRLILFALFVVVPISVVHIYMRLSEHRDVNK
jgi:hypothetical protein